MTNVDRKEGHELTLSCFLGIRDSFFPYKTEVEND